MKITRISAITALLLVGFLGCARDFIAFEGFDLIDPVGRVVPQERLVKMPSYQQSNLICSRTDLYLDRENRLAKLTKTIDGVNSDLKRSSWLSTDCGFVGRASCIFCDTEYDYECVYDPNDEWLDAALKTREEAKKLYSGLNKEHKKAYQDCFSYVEKLTFDERYELHESALEPPGFMPANVSTLLIR